MPNFLQNYLHRRIASMPAAELAPLVVDKLDSYLSTYERSGNKLTHGSSADEQALDESPSTYFHRSMIIQKKAYHINNPQARNFVAKYCAWVEAGVFKVAEHLSHTPPLFAMPGTEMDEEPPEHEVIKRWWEDNQGSKIFRKMVEKSRIHGWTLTVPIKTVLPPWYLAPKCHIFSADEAIANKWEYGHPTSWEINPSNINLEFKPNPVPITQAIFFDHNWSDDFDGIMDIMPLWDDAIDYIMIQDAINAFDARYGNGFLTVVVPSNTKPEEKAKIEEKIRNIRTEMGLVIKGNVNEPVVIDWMGMGGVQVDFVSHLNKIEDKMSLALRFPKRWLLGDAEGAMESSGKDALQVNIELKVLFEKYKDYIYALLMFHGLIQSRSDVIIKPAFEMQLSEQERLQLDKLKTDTIAAKAWLTDNEKRELDGYDAIDDPAMDSTGAQKEAQQQERDAKANEALSLDKNIPKEKPTSEPKPRFDSFMQAESFFNTLPVRELASLCNISEGSVSKIRESLKSAKTPVIKTDALAKMDSVQIADDVYEIQDALLVPVQEKYYDSLGYTAIRSKEAVQQAFDSPATPREFRVGITPNDDHGDSIEVPSDYAIGTARLERMTDEGIRGTITYDLGKIRDTIGDSNWVEANTKKGLHIPTSVALRSTDIPIEKNKRLEVDLDIRSFVLTRAPRNANAGGK